MLSPEKIVKDSLQDHPVRSPRHQAYHESASQNEEKAESSGKNRPRNDTLLTFQQTKRAQSNILAHRGKVVISRVPDRSWSELRAKPGKLAGQYFRTLED